MFGTSSFWIASAIIAVISYLLGSLNFALLLSRIFAGDDIRRHGSGNAGMTNILRTYGAGPAIATLAGDFLKALAAVVIARFIFIRFGIDNHIFDAGYTAGFFVLIGHLYPLYFGFRGGKGVVVSLGVMFILNPLVFLIMMVIFLPVVFITKIVSLASVLGAVAYPVLTWLLLWMRGIPAVYDTINAAIFSVVILLKHRENIARLLNGTENKFGQKK